MILLLLLMRGERMEGVELLVLEWKSDASFVATGRSVR